MGIFGRKEQPIELSGEARQSALDVARAHCDEKGWPFLEPYSVKKQGDRLFVLTRVGVRGGNVRIELDEAGLSVVESGYANH
jgi:hypothetical protein